jgi:hypothetical protein
MEEGIVGFISVGGFRKIKTVRGWLSEAGSDDERGDINDLSVVEIEGLLYV